MLRLTLALSVLLFAFVSQLANAQSCDFLLHQGVFDEQSMRQSVTNETAFLSWYCEQNFSSQSAADSFGASIGAPFDGLSVALGFKGSSQNFEQWQSNLCQEVRSGTRYQSQFQSHMRTVSTRLIDAVEKCINRQGFHVWIERSDNPNRFALAAKFVTPGVPPLVTNVEVDTGGNVTCPNLAKMSTVGGSTVRVQCTRSGREAVFLTVNGSLDPLGGGDLRLPAIPPPCRRISVGERLSRGDAIIITFDRMSTNLGTIIAGASYRVWFERARNAWHGAGPQASDRVNYVKDASYGPDEMGGKIYAPTVGNSLVLWGAPLDFDSTGRIYRQDKPPTLVGHFSFEGGCGAQIVCE